MTDDPQQTLQDRIEAKAREAWPVWEWLLILWLLGMPILLGLVYTAMVENAAGGALPYERYQTVLYVMSGSTAVMFITTTAAVNRGWHRRLLGWSEPSRIAPGPFRFGWALLEIYGRRWMGFVLMMVGLQVLKKLVGIDEVDTVPEIFWVSQALFGWFFAGTLALLVLVSFVGLFVQLRLRDRGGRL
jgi:hypothetical protein